MFGKEDSILMRRERREPLLQLWAIASPIRSIILGLEVLNATDAFLVICRMKSLGQTSEYGSSAPYSNPGQIFTAPNLVSGDPTSIRKAPLTRGQKRYFGLWDFGSYFLLRQQHCNLAHQFFYLCTRSMGRTCHILQSRSWGLCAQ